MVSTAPRSQLVAVASALSRACSVSSSTTGPSWTSSFKAFAASTLPWPSLPTAWIFSSRAGVSAGQARVGTARTRRRANGRVSGIVILWRDRMVGECWGSARKVIIQRIHIIFETVGDGTDQAIPQMPRFGVPWDALGNPACFLPIPLQDLSFIHDPELAQIRTGQKQFMLAAYATDHFKINGSDDSVCLPQLDEHVSPLLGIHQPTGSDRAPAGTFPVFDEHTGVQYVAEHDLGSPASKSGKSPDDPLP